MARLIPAFPDERTPLGECDVFTRLAAGPADWIAFHSLDLAPANKGLRTEIDFVVVIPDTGIVCIEVKSHANISYANDQWQPQSISRSPFKQAADGRYAFYRKLKQFAPILSSTPVVHLCIFPNARFDVPANFAVSAWELIDSRQFRTYPSSLEFCADIKRKVRQAIDSDATLHALHGSLSTMQIERIIALCGPVQKWQPDRRTEIDERERQAASALCEQQKPVLMMAALNPRLVITGPAGTGKTLIALELARRKAASGLRTGFLCFNRLVGDWISEKVRETDPPVPLLVAGSALKVLAEMCGIAIPEIPDANYWHEDLPYLIEERLTDPDFRAQAVFDCLVLDEVQDLLARPRIWHALSAFLQGGFDRGSYVLMGDIENQVLADRAEMLKTVKALEQSSRPAVWQFSENCRNYPSIGSVATTLSGLGSTIYSSYRRTGGHTGQYDISFYSDENEQDKLLRDRLQELKESGYRPAETTVLSFCAPERSAAERLRIAGVPLRPLWKSGLEVGYGSVHAFKGMENKNVVITDVLLRDEQLQRSLFYVGMTRATESVRIFCHVDSKKTLFAWMAKGNVSA